MGFKCKSGATCVTTIRMLGGGVYHVGMEMVNLSLKSIFGGDESDRYNRHGNCNWFWENTSRGSVGNCDVVRGRKRWFWVWHRSRDRTQESVVEKSINKSNTDGLRDLWERVNSVIKENNW